MVLTVEKIWLAFIGLGVGAVDPDKIELLIKACYQHVSMLEDRFKQVCGFAQRFLGLFPLGNISYNADPSDYPAFIILQRAYGVLARKDLTILSLHHKLKE